MSEQQLALAPERQLAEPSIGQLIQAVVEAGITPQSVEVMERLCALREREDARAAQRAYAIAFSALQAELPSVVAERKGDRFVFAPFEDIMRKVQPFLKRHGFSVRFDMEDGDGKICVSCIVTHAGGHSETTRSTVRTSGPPKVTAAQTDGSTMTYGKRYALCNALNIVVDKLDHDGGEPVDARNLGDFIPAEKAAELERRAKACMEPGNIKPLLEFLGAKSFATIFTTRLEDAEWNISECEKVSPPKKKKVDLANPEDPDIEF